MEQYQSHATQRLRERINPRLDSGHVKAIADLIRDNNYLNLAYLESGRQLVRVFLDGVCVYAIWSPCGRGRVVTILTKAMAIQTLQTSSRVI